MYNPARTPNFAYPNKANATPFESFLRLWGQRRTTLVARSGHADRGLGPPYPIDNASAINGAAWAAYSTAWDLV